MYLNISHNCFIFYVNDDNMIVGITVLDIIRKVTAGLVTNDVTNDCCECVLVGTASWMMLVTIVSKYRAFVERINNVSNALK